MRGDRFVIAGLIALPLASGMLGGAPLAAQTRSTGIEYADIDRDRDGVITRAEWQAAFNEVDGNRDGVLSGNEVRRDAPRGGRAPLGEAALREQFVSLDRNGDGSINRGEWKATRDEFNELDLNRNDQITRAEFGIGAAGGGARTVDVDARASWVSTGLTVISGEAIALVTEGSVQLSEDAGDTANPAGSQSGRLAANAPMPQALAGALIGRIGRSAPFAVGDLRQIIAPASGELFLGVNDDHLVDNQGRFRVRISLR